MQVVLITFTGVFNSGHVDIVKLLLDSEGDVNASRTNDGATPLYTAALNGHVVCTHSETVTRQ